jgi:hypothetical protein
MKEKEEVRLLSSLRAILEWMASSPWRLFPLIFRLSLTIRIQQVNKLLASYPTALAPTGNREVEAIAISLY